MAFDSKYRITMFDTVSGIRTCDVTGERTRCLCIKLRQPKRTYYVSRELIIDMLEGVVGKKLPFIIYPLEMVKNMMDGKHPVSVEGEFKEQSDGQSGTVLPPVLDNDEGVLPADAGEDDKDRAGVSGSSGSSPKTVKKTKKKKAKRKGSKAK